jgi:hypothetical protein
MYLSCQRLRADILSDLICAMDQPAALLQPSAEHLDWMGCQTRKLYLSVPDGYRARKL